MNALQTFIHQMATGFRLLLGRGQPGLAGPRILYEGYISGYQYHKGRELEHLFTPGTCISLRHEPENPFDDDAVALYYENKRLGFLPQGFNEEVARLIKQGRRLKARISRFVPDREPWQRVEVEIVNLTEEDMYQ